MGHVLTVETCYLLPTQGFVCFVWIWEKAAVVSLYGIDWFNRNLTFYIPVVTICTASLTFNNSTFCPHSVFMCFVWLWEQTAIISLYSINWLVYRLVRKIAESDYYLCHICLFVCQSVFPHGPIRLPQNGFSWCLIFEFFQKSLERISSLKSANNNEYFTWRIVYIFDYISLSSS